VTTLRHAWDAQADEWARFARTPGHDVEHERLNLPAFLELLPPPGRRTLDVGCGEGRIGAELGRRGHRVVGVDTSPRMVELARERHDAVVADAAALPFADGSFDLVVAYMSLMNMDELHAAVREIGRVLEPGGRLCVAIVHPLNRPLEALDDYFSDRRFAEEVERAGLRMTFESIDRPLEAYTRALAAVGFVIEQVREPRPTAATVASSPQLAKAAKRPYFLHMRCRLVSYSPRAIR
jgi:SAM-dependent methyltransferase